MKKLLQIIFGIFGFLGFILLVIIAKDSEKYIAYFVALFGSGLYLCAGGQRLMEGNKLTVWCDKRIIPASIVLFVVYEIAWFFL